MSETSRSSTTPESRTRATISACSREIPTQVTCGVVVTSGALVSMLERDRGAEQLLPRGPHDVGDLAGQPQEKVQPEIERLAAHPDEPAPNGESLNAFLARYVPAAQVVEQVLAGGVFVLEVQLAQHKVVGAKL